MASPYANPNFLWRSIRARFSVRWIAERLRRMRLTGRPWNRRARVSRKIPLRFTRRVKLYNSEFPGSPSFLRTIIAIILCRSGGSFRCRWCRYRRRCFLFHFYRERGAFYDTFFHEKIMDGHGRPRADTEPIRYPVLIDRGYFSERVIRP